MAVDPVRVKKALQKTGHGLITLFAGARGEDLAQGIDGLVDEIPYAQGEPQTAKDAMTPPSQRADESKAKAAPAAAEFVKPPSV